MKTRKYVTMEEIEQLSAQVAKLRKEIEDLKDIRDFEAARRENGDEPLIPWEEVKKDLDL